METIIKTILNCMAKGTKNKRSRNDLKVDKQRWQLAQYSRSKLERVKIPKKTMKKEKINKIRKSKKNETKVP